MAAKWTLSRGSASSVGFAVLIAFVPGFHHEAVRAAEPVIVINAERLPDVPPEAQPQIEPIGPAGPPVASAETAAAAPSFDPNFLPSAGDTVVAAAPAAAAETAESVPADSKTPVVALQVKPQPSPAWEKQGEYFTRPGLTTITRYNRKVTRTVGDERTPIVAAASPAAADPRFNVIECVAGCKGPKGSIVYYALRLSSRTGQPIEPPGAVAAVAPAPAPMDQNVIACVAGCYSTPKSYIARFPVAKAQAGPAGVYPVSAPLGALVPASAVLADVVPANVRPRSLVASKRVAVQRLRKPKVWQTVVVRPAYQDAYRGWRTNIRY